MKNEIVKNSDLGVSACWLAKGGILKRLEPIDHRRVAFVFQLEDWMKEDEQRFWNDTLLINAKAYFSAIKELKLRLHASSGTTL